MKVAVLAAVFLTFLSLSGHDDPGLTAARHSGDLDQSGFDSRTGGQCELNFSQHEPRYDRQYGD